VSFQEKVAEVRNGFQRAFWVANGMELFERLAYYGQATVLSIYLRNHLSFTPIEAGQISSVFGGLIYFLPIFAGTIADKIGFRKAFSFAFFVLGLGYFLVATTGIGFFQPVYAGLPMYWTLIAIFIFTAIGGSFIKPSVLGTVAVASTPATKSLGYAVYYWLVNIGGAVGPVLAFIVRDTVGIEFVYLVSSVSCFLMFAVNHFFYNEVRTGAAAAPVETLGVKLKNLVVVLGNAKFMIFLLIFSLFWIMYWQVFIIVPFYVTDYIAADAPFEIIQSAGAWSIIILQLVVNRMTKHLSPRTAIVAGFAASSICWLIIAMNPTVLTVVVGIVVLAIGEMTQAPRYYEYISDLAPKGQQGLFQGYAFLPIAIAWFVGGPLGGWLYETFARQQTNPNIVWYSLFAIGAAATVMMSIYNVVVGRSEQTRQRA